MIDVQHGAAFRKSSYSTATFAEADFRKSSYSDPEKQCVEVGHTAVLLGGRDSKLSHSPVVAVTAKHGRAFLDAVKTGRFDL